LVTYSKFRKESRGLTGRPVRSERIGSDERYNRSPRNRGTRNTPRRRTVATQDPTAMVAECEGQVPDCV
jgi:hypothetical protein